MAIKRAVSIDELTRKVFKEIELEGEWKNSIGIPEMSGVWLVWGQSGSGKSRFTMQLAKCLAHYAKVAFDALEEGARKTIQKNVIETNLSEVKNKMVILNREPIEELKIRLRKKKSPDIIILDSLQYTGLTKKEYIELKEEFHNKLFIFISHAQGKEPKGAVADFIRYDADVKIWIEGYRAFITSRYGGGAPYTIWEEGASDYWKLID